MFARTSRLEMAMGPSAWDLSPARVYWLSALRDHDEDRARRAQALTIATGVSQAIASALASDPDKAGRAWDAWAAQMTRD